MGTDYLPTDHLERERTEIAEVVSRLQARDLVLLEELDRRQVATRDGSRSLSEWVAATDDVSLDTARRKVRTMRRTTDRSQLREALASGEISFDRVEALSKIAEDVGFLRHLDVSGVYREAAKRTRISVESEAKTAESNFMVMQPTLDETWVNFWGGLDGYSGGIVDKVLTEAADQLPPLPDGSRCDRSWRKATALVGLCMGEDPPPVQVTVFVDVDQATNSNGEAGVMLEAGPKAGRQALEAILCDTYTELTVNREDGVPMMYGRRSRTVPPQLRRVVINAAGGVCAADGCNSRYRIEAHHITPWSQGGSTDPENLVALCWFHHHIVIHQRGFHIYRHPDHGRIRFRKPPPDRPT
jgi:hypothetical protein